MKLEQQVVSLELAKRLKELGVKQDSIYGWYDTELAGPLLVNLENESTLARKYGDAIPAFTVAELGETLPVGYRSFRRFAGEELVWRCEAADEHNKDRWPIEADTEADARAKMHIYLLENKLFTTTKVTKK